ncbi:unnamed protein product [Brassicogethes aeneus]|uniref:AAA+ ATPase domain-containing protein n=1 Tax=Brassicogethes aeneus TaxID=1431903 RepID=A0A9P0BIT0_BRAAE|nr:unnamed protein product [Brassicogethes aeneus]
MSEYPDEDEEFELMYGDELELLNEQENFNDPVSKSRKSLDFNTPSTSKVVEKDDNNPQTSKNRVNDDVGFDDDFEYISEASNGVIQSQTNDNGKRSIQDLFGDIDDLLNEDKINKKHKGDKLLEELSLIEHILELRKLSKEKSNALATRNYTTYNNDRDKYNISYNVPKYPFIAITRHDSERVYIRCHSEAFEKEESDRIIKESNGVSILGENSKKIWEGALKILSNEDNLEEVTIDVPENNAEQLWVDMYKPRKYLELLSDESTNRIMLKWIKLWDKVVFNRKPKIKPVKVEEDPKKKKFFQREQLISTLDEHGRPHHKIALLCGPPGLGKTTLAHMVAKHAGYNVYELNASDDRTVDAFKTALENATQMRSVIDKENRPNCIILDEIDGAPSASIEYLIKYVNGTAPVKAKKGEKAKKPNICKRPVICICNDAFTPALRPLKQVAFVVNFPRVSSSRLAERLMEIAKRQQVKTYQGAMLALAEKSKNDIRSCLSILHFFKALNKPVTLTDVYKSSVGQKDMQKGLFSVWEDIFRIERPKMLPGQDIALRNVTLRDRMNKVLQTVSSFGDYERVGQGVFENFPSMKFKDNNMENVCAALDWFGFTDLVSKQIYQLQNYSLGPYLQYAFVQWHFVFGSPNHQKINFPTQGYEAKLKTERQRAVVKEVMKGMTTSVRAYCQKISLTLDIFPLLLRIIVPTFRPVSLHLYTAEEKNELLKLVSIMIDYNLNYVQERTTEGTYVYKLEPNIGDIVIFDRSSKNDVRELSYPNKQLVAREIEMEKMRRIDLPNKNIVTNKEMKTPQRNGVPESSLPNHLQTLKARQVKGKTSPGVVKDFFGRIIKQASTLNESTSKKPTNDIWYQYKEGYNNAVRKNIKILSLK